MANLSNVEAMLSGIQDPALQAALKAAFRYILKSNIRFGNVEPSIPSTNMGGGFFQATTPSTPNQEFVIPHSFGASPYMLIPTLPLDAVNASIVRLTTTRVADATNVYLKSPDVSAVIRVYLEG